VEIAIRDTNAFDGLGQEQCRKRQRIMGVNTFRMVMTAARTLWFIAQVECGTRVYLYRYRPRYRQKVALSQRDVVWACREALQEPAFFPYHGWPRSPYWPLVATQDESLCPLHTLSLRSCRASLHTEAAQQTSSSFTA
jgi:hypothetical protein